MTPTTRIAVDVGGTFTDVVRLDPATGALRFDKVPTTPADPTRGVLDAFAKVATDPRDINLFTHGTTLGLNALLTRRGARTAVVGTAGFRDVYLLGRTDRRVNYDITYRKPMPLLQRYDTYEVRERSLFDGSIHEPIDLADAERVARSIAKRGYEAVAVAFLHSYANPDHELAMRDVLQRFAPGVAVTLSHELSREYREYERTSTAVIDAYIKPIVGRYLARLEDELSSGGFEGRFLMTRSGGGAMTAAAAREMPVSLVLSGPAGGVVGAAAFAKLVGEPGLITIDMGGTSLDASLILDNEPVLYQGAEFEQMPINMPSLYIHTIGAGGGSIAWLDAAGVLQVGPQSAGATPGPASYGRGGTEPTFTDAAVVLGHLGADTALGGTLTLDDGLARKALAPLAEALGMSVPDLALGIVRISTTKIVGAVRAITVDLGRDPKDFALLSLGGAGGLVATDVARELGIGRVIVPPGQGAFCAFGMLMADVQHDFARTKVMPLADLTNEFAAEAFSEMEAQAQVRLVSEGFELSRQTMRRLVDVRYAGQEHSVTVAYPNGDDAQQQVADEFARVHLTQYGHVMPDPIEVTTTRVQAIGEVDKPAVPEGLRAATAAQPASTRRVYVGGVNETHLPYDVYIRETLSVGNKIIGPAVVAEHTATSIIHPHDSAEVGPHGELIVHVSPEN